MDLSRLPWPSANFISWLFSAVIKLNGSEPTGSTSVVLLELVLKLWSLKYSFFGTAVLREMQLPPLLPTQVVSAPYMVFRFVNAPLPMTAFSLSSTPGKRTTRSATIAPDLIRIGSLPVPSDVTKCALEPKTTSSPTSTNENLVVKDRFRANTLACQSSHPSNA